MKTIKIFQKPSMISTFSSFKRISGILFFSSLVVDVSSATIYDQYTSEAQTIVNGMTLQQKIGQMLLPTFPGITTVYAPDGMAGAQAAWGDSGAPTPSLELGDALGFSAITTYNIGAVLQPGGPLSYSGTDPEDQVISQWQALTATAQLYQTEGLPLLLGTDAVHGNQHVVGSILFPHNIGLGATHNPTLINQIGAWVGYNVRLSGFNWAYAPTVAIVHDYRWGRSYESFSSNTDVVQALAQNYVAGLQGISDATTGQVTLALACCKHFIGDGQTQTGIDEGFSYSPDLQTLWETNGAGYSGAVALTDPIAQAGSAMASYNSLNGIPMHFGGDFNVLSEFRNYGVVIGDQVYKLSGFVASDYDGVARAAWKYNVLHNTTLTLAEAMAMSINGGVDLFMVSNAAYTNPFDANTFIPPSFQNLSPPYYTNLQDVITAITTAVETGLVSMSRIDDAVTRIIRTKLAINFDPPSPPAGVEADIALQAAEQSLVLLKNNESVIPRTPGNMEYVFLIGSYDDIGIQNGGWTINWQGQKGNYYWSGAQKASSHASSVLDGVNNTQLHDDAQIILGETNALNTPLDGVNASNSIAIFVINEIPYAEFMGDVQNQNPWYIQGATQGQNAYETPEQNCFLGVTFTKKQIQTINYLKSAGVPIVTVLFSGRPVVITEGNKAPLPKSDAFIAAFLPGPSGGQAVANVIFGSFITKSVSNVINGNTYYSNTLPFAWPASMREVMKKSPTLYPEGYGL
jgi:beta-glucosidase